MRHIPATEFKAKCLELMDRVAERRETYVITKRGKPVAKLVPADPAKKDGLFGCMADQTAFVANLDQPLWTEEQWKELERQRLEQAKAWEREWRTHGTISGKETVGQPRRPAKGRTKRPTHRPAAKR
ncbi:MAG TPA: type II toxin-antitoxin system Phd/YefM family antitoxin [Vicinamibacteria bacterium]|nr:type II toxin-antitoxin system Phd/YefM family antitoxin [Vicinamibacteria bacterium]